MNAKLLIALVPMLLLGLPTAQADPGAPHCQASISSVCVRQCHLSLDKIVYASFPCPLPTDPLPVNCSNVELAWHENVDLPIPPVGPGPKGNGLVSVFVWYPTIGSTRGNEALFQDCYLPYGCHEISELTAELCITVS